LFVGRLEKTKGVETLLRVFTERPGEACLRIAGFGDLEPAVRRAAESSERISYLGRLDRGQVQAEMKQASAVVIPSLWEENCPMVLLESYANRTPCVVADRGGLPEFVSDGADGLVVPAGDVEALAQALEFVTQNPSVAAAWGQRAYERLVTQHSPAQYYERLSNVYARAKQQKAKAVPC
ncbi:MAG: glycosyltransferase, partial [Alphaproteobacteria bacterium]